MVVRKYVVEGLRKDLGLFESKSFCIKQERIRKRFFFFSEKYLLPRAYLAHRIEAKEMAEAWTASQEYVRVRIYEHVVFDGWSEEKYDVIRIWENGRWTL